MNTTTTVLLVAASLLIWVSAIPSVYLILYRRSCQARLNRKVQDKYMNDVKVVLEQMKVITKDDISEEQLKEIALSLTYTQQQISTAVSEVAIMSMMNGEKEISEDKVIRSVTRVIRALAKRDGLYDEYDELVKKAKSQAKSVYVYAYVSSILVGTAALISLIISSL